MNKKTIGSTAVTAPDVAGGVEKFWNHLDEQSQKRLIDAADKVQAKTERGWRLAVRTVRSNPWTSAGIAALTAAVAAGLVVLLSKED